jgi:AcrR family transcriptional regulator
VVVPLDRAVLDRQDVYAVNFSRNADGVNIGQDGDVRTSSSTSRASYHHGNLTEALTEAAVTLARAGGPEAVVLREAARKVGVSATAAYRHFAGHSELKEAVKQACQEQLRGHMMAAVSSGDPLPDPRAEALRKLRAIAWGYLTFARAEPGLYRTAFCKIDKPHQDTDLAMIDSPAYALLSSILDEALATGAMRPQRRPMAEAVAWSMAHGLAMLIVDGPLAFFDEDVLHAAIDASVEVLIAGFQH